MTQQSSPADQVLVLTFKFREDDSIQQLGFALPHDPEAAEDVLGQVNSCENDWQRLDKIKALQLKEQNFMQDGQLRPAYGYWRFDGTQAHLTFKENGALVNIGDAYDYKFDKAGNLMSSNTVVDGVAQYKTEPKDIDEAAALMKDNIVKTIAKPLYTPGVTIAPRASI